MSVGPLVIDCAAALAAAVGLALAGWFGAAPLTTALIGGAGIEEVIMLSPTSFLLAQAKLALALALGPLASVAALTIAHMRGSEVPKVNTRLTYLMAPTLAGALGVGAQAVYVFLALSSFGGTSVGAVAPVAISSAAPGGWGILLAGLAGLGVIGLAIMEPFRARPEVEA